MSTAKVEDVKKPFAPNPVLRRLYEDKKIEVESVEVEVYELMSSVDFADMFYFFDISLENLWMTKRQKEVYCEIHSKYLGRDECDTYFLQKKCETEPAKEFNLFITPERRSSGGRNSNAYSLRRIDGWYTCRHNRLVTPKLITKLL